MYLTRVRPTALPLNQLRIDMHCWSGVVVSRTPLEWEC